MPIDDQGAVSDAAFEMNCLWGNFGLRQGLPTIDMSLRRLECRQSDVANYPNYISRGNIRRGVEPLACVTDLPVDASDGSMRQPSVITRRRSDMRDGSATEEDAETLALASTACSNPLIP